MTWMGLILTGHLSNSGCSCLLHFQFSLVCMKLKYLVFAGKVILSLLQSTEKTWFVSSLHPQPTTFQFPQTHIQKRQLASLLCHLMPCLLQKPHISRWYNSLLRGYYVVVITMTGLKDGWRKFNLWQGQGFSSSPQHPYQLWSPPSLLYVGYWGPFH